MSLMCVQVGQKAPGFKMEGIFGGEILRVLKALQTGEMCPVEWKPGKSTLGKA